MLPYWLHPELRKMRWKKVKDPVYEYVYFNEIEKAVIDHPLTQRLRYICQLQLARLVYPSAEHSRFQHSLGVMHAMGIISSKVLSKLEAEKEKGGLTHEDFTTLVLASRLAGLLHDIGHIFLSHWAEEYLLSRARNIGFYSSHEEIGQILYKKFFRSYLSDYLQKKNDIKDIINVDLLLKAVDALMTPLEEPISLKTLLEVAEQSLSEGYKEYSKYLVPLIQALRGWLYTADELDYIMRDGRSAGVLGYGAIDWLRMLEETEVCHLMKKEAYVLCVRSWRKFSPAFVKYLDSFISLYRYCYLHKSAKAFERLLGRIFESDTIYFLNILSSLKNAIEKSQDIFAASYELWKFTDSIQLYEIIGVAKRLRKEEWMKKLMARERPLKCIFEAYIWCTNYEGFITLKNIVNNIKDGWRKGGDVELLNRLVGEAGATHTHPILSEGVSNGQVLFGEISLVRPKLLNYDMKEEFVIDRERKPTITLKLKDFCDSYIVPLMGRPPSFAKILVFVDEKFGTEDIIPNIKENIEILINMLCERHRDKIYKDAIPI